MSTSIFALLILFQMKHLLADYVWQTPYMLGKGKKGFDFVLPLSAHCTVHAGLTMMLIVAFDHRFVWLAIPEFFAHFIIDRIKATYKLPQGQWSNEDKGRYLGKYYFAFGVDQMAHHICYLAIAYIIGAS